MRSLDSASTGIGQRQLEYLPRTDYDLIKAHSYAAVITLFLSAIAGLLVALKLTLPELLGNHAALSWGRLRFDHTQGIFFGWLGNAFFAFCYHMVPRLADRPVYSRKLGWGIFLLWNFGMLLPGWTSISLGLDNQWLAVQSLEWAEFPMLIDLLAVLGLLLICVQFAGPFVLKRQSGGVYISVWYLVGGAVFSLLAYPVGNFVPAFVPGAQGAAFSGLWIHDAVGLFVTPFVLAMAYYIIPATTQRLNLQPLSVDDRLLVSVFLLSLEWHPPLRLLGSANGCAEGGDHCLGVLGDGRNPRGIQPVDFAARAGGEGRQ